MNSPEQFLTPHCLIHIATVVLGNSQFDLWCGSYLFSFCHTEIFQLNTGMFRIVSASWRVSETNEDENVTFFP